MLAASTETWWIVGWIVGGAVVLVAAALLLAIIALARRIVRQAGAISAALVGARANTEPLFDLASVNYSLEQITRLLRGAQHIRKPDPGQGSDPGGLRDRLSRGMRTLLEGGEGL